jgi:hypothetical protein
MQNHKLYLRHGHAIVGEARRGDGNLEAEDRLQTPLSVSQAIRKRSLVKQAHVDDLME